MLCALNLKGDISDLPQFVKFSGRYFYISLENKVKNLISLVSGHPYYHTISTQQDPTEGTTFCSEMEFKSESEKECHKGSHYSVPKFDIAQKVIFYARGLFPN